MGLEILFGPQESWGHKLLDLLGSQEEVQRRRLALERVSLYRDNYKAQLRYLLASIFTEPAVYQRLEPLIELVGGSSFVKRVADELGRPLYAQPPIRRVVLPGGGDASRAQEAYNEMLKEMDANAKMDAIARQLTFCNRLLGFVRYVPDVGMQLDVITPNERKVFGHPQAPTFALAVAYIKTWQGDKPYAWQIWTAERYFTLGPRGGVSDAQDHDFGLLPFLDVKRRGFVCDDETSGEDLISQTKQSMFLDLVSLKKIKQQSHLQLTYTGDLDNLVKDQVSDEESVLVAHGNGSFGLLNLESDPAKIQAVKSTNESAVAANYGISRDRLNQSTQSPSDDAALHERVAELGAVMAPAEARLFEIVKRVSREHPKYAGWIPDDAQILVDLGQIHNRVDRSKQLADRQTERTMGLRSGVDDVLEDNPEFGGDRERAMKHIDEKMAEEALIVEKRRALNAPAGGTTPDEPGQTPEQNGALGPAVRDGKMTRDEASRTAKTGGADLYAMAQRVLRAAQP